MKTNINQGLTKYQRYLKSEHWQNFRLSVLKTTNGLCERCGSFKPLDLHHLEYCRLGRELRSDVQAICRECHTKEHCPEATAKGKKQFLANQRKNAAKRKKDRRDAYLARSVGRPVTSDSGAALRQTTIGE